VTDTIPAPSPGEDDRAETAGRMAAIAAALTAAGLDAQVNDTRGVLDITAAWHRPGCKDIEIIYDEDRYAQISYWSAPDATPAEVVATITRALAVIAMTASS
jgi:hypothetical protein